MASRLEPIKIVKDCLLAGYAAYEKILKGGQAKAVYGKQIDVTTKADVYVGQAILGSLRKTNLPLVVFAEEQGTVKLSDKPKYSVIFDDIDGTLNFRDGHNMLPHGSIVGVFDSPDPRFCDCQASGFLEFNSGNLFYAVKGKGAFLSEGWAKGKKVEVKIHTSGRTNMLGKTFLRLVPDLYSLGHLAPCFAKYSDRAWMGDFRSKAVHLALVACGSADIFVCVDNCHIKTKKATGEEIGPGYLLIKEAGGAMLDWLGEDVAKERVGLQEKRTFHTVAAATEELGKEFVKEMHKTPEIVAYLKKRNIL